MSVVETPNKTRVFPVIGLEVHAQLETRSKIFCPCAVTVGAPANSATCPVCLGFPGTLPVLNREAVTLALRLATAVGATIHRESQFARKNYFYPDLPKGYQISQYDRPFSTGGAIVIDTPQGEKAIRLVRAHLEEDAGKLLHDTPLRRRADRRLARRLEPRGRAAGRDRQRARHPLAPRRPPAT